VISRRPCVIKLIYVVATLSETVRENVQGKVLPRLLIVVCLVVAFAS
jgi:hypothetical protein